MLVNILVMLIRSLVVKHFLTLLFYGIADITTSKAKFSFIDFSKLLVIFRNFILP
jgi:hypothetical protein